MTFSTSPPTSRNFQVKESFPLQQERKTTWLLRSWIKNQNRAKCVMRCDLDLCPPSPILLDCLLIYLFFSLFIWLCPVLAETCEIFNCSMGTLNCSMRDLVLWPGIKSRSLTLGTQILSHWTTREIHPVLLFLQKKEDWTLPASTDLPRPPTLHLLTRKIYFYLIGCPSHEDTPMTSILQRELNMGNFLTKLSSHGQ